MWKYPEVNYPKKNSNNCVLTVATGYRGKLQLDRWGYSHRDYADSIGVDYVLIEGPTTNKILPQMDKFVVGNILEVYDRVLLIDSDIEVLSDAPDMFKIVPEELLGLTDLSLYVHSSGLVEDVKRCEDTAKLECLKFYKTFRHLSSGFYVVSKCHKDLFKLPTVVPNPIHNCFEQDLMGARIFSDFYKYRAMWFGPELQWIHNTGNHEKGHTYFHHYTGVLQS